MFDGTLTPPLNFVYTQPMPCPYIHDKMERRLATDISSIRGQKCHNILAEAGFRRSQHISYKPACPSCNACKPIRVLAKQFTWNKTQKRVFNRNNDLIKNHSSSDRLIPQSSDFETRRINITALWY